MKKNLIPLIAIAFVVALLATGLFYGLVVSSASAGPNSSAKLPAAEQKPVDPADELGIPVGMRAISVQVSDSSGVLAMLKEAHKVDVMAVYTRNGGEDFAAKTILEDIQVLRVNTQPEPSPGRPALPVVTLLATPAEADILGVADASARLRLVLRNPHDEEKTPRSTLTLTTVVRGSSQ